MNVVSEITLFQETLQDMTVHIKIRIISARTFNSFGPFKHLTFVSKRGKPNENALC